MSELFSIVYKPKDAAPLEADYVRVPLNRTRLIADYGIEDDAKGGSSNRQLNLMSVESLEQLAQEGFRTTPGQMGEQLIVSGLNLNQLPLGTRLQIGASACVELTEPRTGCAKFERYQHKAREEATGRLGMMARVISEGDIHVGDSVQVLGDAENTDRRA